MATVIAFKWTKSPADVRVDGDGRVGWDTSKMAVSDDDAAAIAVARDLAGEGELVGVTIGDGDNAWAAARGASRTVVVADGGYSRDAALTARLLAGAVQRVEGADVVLMGDSLWDQAVPSALGAELGWTVLLGITSATVDGDFVEVTRGTSTGSEVVRARKPVLLGIAARRTEEKPPGMKDVLMARKKPLEKLSVEELGITTDSPVAVRDTTLPPPVSAQLFDGSDPSAAAASLVATLRSEGVLR